METELKKFRRSVKKKFNDQLCLWLGHKRIRVIEQRWRGGYHYNFSHKGGRPRKGAHYVAGCFEKCSRCGKKLSNFKRFW